MATESEGEKHNNLKRGKKELMWNSEMLRW